jgi:hypothetical protein
MAIAMDIRNQVSELYAKVAETRVCYYRNLSSFSVYKVGAKYSKDYNQMLNTFKYELAGYYKDAIKLLGKRNFKAAERYDTSAPKNGKKITKDSWRKAVSLVRELNDSRDNYRLYTDRFDRKEFTMPTPQDLLQRKIKSDRFKRETTITLALGYTPTFGSLTVEFKKDIVEPRIVNVSQNLGRYSSRCSYQKVEHNCTIIVRRDWKVENIDGIPTIISHTKNVDGLTINKGWTLSRVRTSYVVKYEPVICVQNQIGLAAHGTDLRKCIQSLNRKFKVLQKSSGVKKKLALDDYISVEDYRDITGACQFGCEQFCEREGLDAHGRIKVRDLIGKLKINDYGAKQFWATVDINENKSEQAKGVQNG